MVIALGLLALSSLGSSFIGSTYLLVGGIGLVLAATITHLTRALGWPSAATALAVLVVFVLFGGPLCLRSLGDHAMLPSATTLSSLLDQAVFGWMDLLTTMPPVDGTGPLLVLPWLLGLAWGFLGVALSHWSTPRSLLAAVAAPTAFVVLLCLMLLIGVAHPASLWLQGALFAAGSLGWVALRLGRGSATRHGSNSGWGRPVAGVVMIGLATAVAVPASSLVGVEDSERVVARNWVTPPFDVGRYPSPLAGFRKYVDPQGKATPANLHDETLFTIKGLKPGSRVRLATMDHYDAMVWGASNDALPEEPGGAFQRVSSVIDNPVEGEPIEAEVTLGPGFSGVWLPTSGALQSMRFDIGDPESKAESFRYNLATATAVVPTGLLPGDTYSFTATQPSDVLEPTTVAFAQTAPPSADTAFLSAPATQWTEAATGPMERVLAIAAHLKREGKYSDGVLKNERQYLSGHGLHRLSDEFINQQLMVGNDEQYAAVMALLALQVGVPARVVLGAVVPNGGVVSGADVSAWVEVRAADGSWRTLATDRFMSRVPPTQQLPETTEPMTGTVIPPPAPIPPPSDIGDQSAADLKKRNTTKGQHSETGSAAGLPGWLLFLGRYVALPLLAIASLLAAIVGLKVLRRRRRRQAASASARFVGAWRELVDHARDLGRAVPLGPTTTRREQSRDLSPAAPRLARQADSQVFGPQPPDFEAAARYWDLVERECRTLSAAATRRRRWLAAVSLTSFSRERR